MNRKTKFIIFTYVVSFIIFLIIWMILHVTFKNLTPGFKGMIAAGFSFFLSPKIKVYKTQSGKQMLLKWIFLRKTITI
ncbi:hypothetical protein MKD41_05585 [Lutibacter sp. A64]|uniref:hypothetical protein n=1 Tax=Lutibacter sp. A64 TaxID=2918526 RepID=UPI001F056D70|nr:hypothetical protein [Lutibacter sp. A64]UMB54944.1 hypothetical protein MKD41_05585 [Lutibacter sp. A64]